MSLQLLEQFLYVDLMGTLLGVPLILQYLGASLGPLFAVFGGCQVEALGAESVHLVLGGSSVGLEIGLREEDRLGRLELTQLCFQRLDHVESSGFGPCSVGFLSGFGDGSLRQASGFGELLFHRLSQVLEL